MVPIKEALTFDDVTLVPKYSEILPSEVDTSIKLTNNLKLRIPLLSSERIEEVSLTLNCCLLYTSPSPRD